MSMWRDQGPNKKDVVPVTPEVPAADGRLFTAEASPAPPVTATATATPSVAPTATAPQQRHSEAKESLIAADISIEGKIEGAGHVRLAGRFKGDVNVKGDLTIERGAKLNGGVRANKVIIAGELEGNIESAAQVELQPPAYWSATSRPAVSPWHPVHACVARPISAGAMMAASRPVASRQTAVAPATRVATTTATPHECTPSGHARRHAQLPALQGDDPGKRQRLPCLQAPPALRFSGCATRAAGADRAAQGRRHHPPPGRWRTMGIHRRGGGA